MKIFYINLFLLLSSIGYSQNACPGLDSINYSSQWYHTVQIGSQCWLKENLNVGNMIPAVKDQINNDTIEKFCYNNDPAMCDMYGGLYQWREAMKYTMKNGVRGICPVGWHVPTNYEYDTLITYVKGDGNALKQIGQGQGTNSSGFSGLLSGINGFTTFTDAGVGAHFWSSDLFFQWETGILDGRNITIWYDSLINPIAYNAAYGLSVRCLKDAGGLFLQTPFGGETWQDGSNHIISWGGDLIDKKIKLDYTTDNGISWFAIINSTPASDGDYNWTVSNTPSKNCKVRITDLNDPNSFSISDSVFTINLDPCSGKSTVQQGDIKYNTTIINGKCWLKENVNIGTMISGSQLPSINGIIEKYCYNDDTANCTIYGGLYTYTEMQEPDICPAFFHLGSINELEQYVLYDANSLKSIGQGTGFGSGSNTSGFSILLSGFRGSNGTFNELGSYSYFIFGSTDSYFANFIDNNTNAIGWTPTVTPDLGGSLRCVRDDVGPLLLKSPAGGESCQIGTTQKIRWTLSNVLNIRIDYSTNNGTNWINIITSTPTSLGSYTWTIPNTPSTNCKVKITSINSSDTNSISNLFSIYQVPINPCPGIPTVNYAGQTYNTVVIGDQCWMRENLNIGSMIDSTQNQSNNGIIEKYCYNDDSIKCSIYGGLYQWDEAMQYFTTDGSKGICPTGWHIPSLNDLSILKSSAGNNSISLKEIGQGTGSGAGTNSSGFSALLAGISRGSFYYLNVAGDWWTSTIYDSSDAYNLQVTSTTNIIQGLPVDIMVGFSIRCLNDLTISELPVELTSFTFALNDDNVLLNWNTATELNSLLFEIERKIVNRIEWNEISSVPASCNSSKPKNYTFLDKNVSIGKYNYRLKMVDLNGSFRYSNIIEAKISTPLKFELSNAYPNPWNPNTTIRYQVPVDIQVKIMIFDVLGKEIKTLVNENKTSGVYEVMINNQNLSSGIYYYQMKAGNFVETKKFILMK